MKKLIISILVTLFILLLYVDVGQAASSEEYTHQPRLMITVSEDEIIMLARLIHSEAGIVDSTMEQAAVVWCVLNRVDDNRWGDTITDVVTQHAQFAWNPNETYDDYLLWLARDVVDRWIAEKMGEEDVGRVLPAEYIYFAGRGGHNWFRTEYRSNDYWDWDCDNPYED